MVTKVLFADDQIPWDKDADNEKVRQEIAKELAGKMPDVNVGYEQDKRWFAELIDSLTTQGVEVSPARTYKEAERRIRESKDFNVAIIDLSWYGDRSRKWKSDEKKNAGLKLIDLMSKQNEHGDRYLPVIALSQNYKTQPLLVATVLEMDALPIQRSELEVWPPRPSRCAQARSVAHGTWGHKPGDPKTLYLILASRGKRILPKAERIMPADVKTWAKELDALNRR